MANPFTQELENRTAGSSDSQAGNPFKAELQNRRPPASEATPARALGQQTLGEPDIGFLDRLRIESGDTFEEKRAILRNIYPEGQLQRVPASDELFFKRNPAESFRALNPPGADITDVGAVLNDYGPIAGEIAATTIRAPATIASAIFRGSMGAMVGEAAQQQAQAIQDVQRQVAGEQAQEVGEQGLVSIGGGIIGGGAAKLADAVMGGGLFKLRPGAREAMLASKELGLDSPLPGQTTESSIINRLQGQAGQTTEQIGQTIARNQEALVNTLRNVADLPPAQRNRAADTIQSALDEANDRALRDAIAITDEVSPEKAGEALKLGLEQYRVNSKEGVDALYNVARQQGDPSFSLDSLKETAETIAKRTTVRTQEGTTEVIPDQLGQVRDIANQIQRTDPSSVGTEQLQAWESALFDLSQPAAGVERTTAQKQAAKLRSSVRETFDNPTGVSDEFTSAWGRAREAAKKRFDTLEKSAIVGIAKSDRPTAIAKNLLSPNIEPETIRLIRRTIPSDKFGELQQAFKNELLANPDKLSQAMADYNPGVLSNLMTPAEIKTFQEAGEKIANLNKTQIQKGLEKQTLFKPLVNDLLLGQRSTASTSAIKNFIEESGGLEGEVGRAFRAGIADEVFRKTVALSRENQESIGLKQFARTMKEFEDKGLTQFLTQSDKNTLAKIFQILPFSEAGGEGVAGLIGAQAVAGAIRPIPRPSAVLTLIRNYGVGQLLTSRAGKFLIQGSARGRTVPKGPAVGTAMVVQDILSNLEEQGKTPESNFDKLLDLASSAKNAAQGALE